MPIYWQVSHGGGETVPQDQGGDVRNQCCRVDFNLTHTHTHSLAYWESQPANPDEEVSECVCCHTSAAERVWPVAHKVDFVWRSPSGRMLCTVGSWLLNYPPSSPVGFIWQDIVSVCVYRCPAPVSCIFAMTLKPESINLTIPVLGVTSMFGYLFLCWPGCTEHPFSLSRKTSCPALVMQWKYTTDDSTAQIVTSLLHGAGLFMSFWLGSSAHLYSE